MKHGTFFFFVVTLMLLCGCGHSTLVDREGTGAVVFVPFLDNTIGVCIGSMKTTSASLRGGASVETTSTHSGGLFSGAGGVSKITNFKTNAQLNEGNIVKVMTSPEVPDEAKVALATNLAAAVKAPKFMPSIMQTEASTIHLGSEAIQSNAVEKIERRSSGIDKIVETIPQVTTPIVETVTDVVDNTAGKVVDGATHLVDRTFDWAIMVKWLGIISAICVVFVTYFKNKKGGSYASSSFESVNPSIKQTSRKANGTKPFGDAPSPVDESGDPHIDEIDVEAAVDAEAAAQQDVDFTEAKKKSLWGKILGILSALFSIFAMLPIGVKKKIAHSTVDWMKQKKEEKSKKQTDK